MTLERQSPHGGGPPPQRTGPRWRRRALALLLGALSLSAAGGCGGPEGERIVLITLDTLRYDSFAGTSGGASSMPRTLERARRGLRFQRYYSTTSITQPSHASILTGLQPWEHGVAANGLVLADELDTVPEILARAGWETAAVVASFPVASRFGFAQGFRRFRDDFDQPLFKNQGWEGHPIPGDDFFTDAEAVTNSALELLDTMEASRQLLWVHYFDPHGPYGDSGGPPPDQAMSPWNIRRRVRRGEPAAEVLAEARRGYETDVAFMDRHLDRLLRRLEADAGRFTTHIIAVSDHGESFGEGGSLAHGTRISDEQIQVPLFVVSPRVEPAVRTDVAGSIDVAATLLALAGCGPAPGGRDLTAPPPPDATALGMRRLFRPGAEERRLDGSVHPLDLPRFFMVDPHGRVFRGNGAGVEAPEGAPARAAGTLERLFASLEEELAGAGAVELADPETREALRALGYVD